MFCMNWNVLTTATSVAIHDTILKPRRLSDQRWSRHDMIQHQREQMLPLLMWKLRNSWVCFLIMKSKHVCGAGRPDPDCVLWWDVWIEAEVLLLHHTHHICPNTSKYTPAPETCNIFINSRPMCWHGCGQIQKSRPGIAGSLTLSWLGSFSSISRARLVSLFWFSYLRQTNISFLAKPYHHS